jgi:prepilin-type N-terminal cleavage/methylation domain-containing protein
VTRSGARRHTLAAPHRQAAMLRSLRPSTTPAGFTLAECLVAITLFAVGLLGLTGTELAVERIGSAGEQRARGAAIAWARLEMIRSARCAARASGAAVTNGTAESWTVVTSAGATTVTDSVTLPSAAGRAPVIFALESAVPC